MYDEIDDCGLPSSMGANNRQAWAQVSHCQYRNDAVHQLFTDAFPNAHLQLQQPAPYYQDENCAKQQQIRKVLPSAEQPNELLQATQLTLYPYQEGFPGFNSYNIRVDQTSLELELSPMSKTALSLRSGVTLNQLDIDYQEAQAQITAFDALLVDFAQYKYQKSLAPDFDIIIDDVQWQN